VVKVAVVAEYYPRARDPVLGVWAHRQALAARDAGADVRVLVLHRPIPPAAAVREHDVRAMLEPLRQRARAELDGIEVRYVRYASPPRPRSYGSWGAWAAPALALALARLRATWDYDLVHAHYAVPAGDAVRRAHAGAPLVVSVHGGDVLSTVHRGPRARRAVERTLAHARLTMANSAETARLCAEHGAGEVRVVHLGTDLPAPREAPAAAGGDAGRDAGNAQALVTVGHLVARKRHADVVRALWTLRERHPGLRYVVVGDGPEREPLRELAASLGVADRVELRGQLLPAEARAAAWAGTAFVLPSVDEAFGVAYVEAMAGGVPAIGCRGEGGPEEIAASGDGIRLVPPGDVEALAAEIDRLLADERWARELGEAARATVRESFTWERCGRETVAAYEAALEAAPGRSGGEAAAG
jgi:glycosyltransferase involved in cell wall biosynthesis